MTLAVPVFRTRLSPVFDSCGKVLLIVVKQGQEVERAELTFQNPSRSERILLVQNAGVTDLICGGISKASRAILENSGIGVISGVVGEVDDVLAAFMANRLDEPNFRMPGYGPAE